MREAAPTEALVNVEMASPSLSARLVVREACVFSDVPHGLPLAPSNVHRLLTCGG